LLCSKDWNDVKLSKLFCNLTYRGVVLQGEREEKRERGEGERRRWREEVRGKRGREGQREGGKGERKGREGQRKKSEGGRKGRERGREGERERGREGEEIKQSMASFPGHVRRIWNEATIMKFLINTVWEGRINSF